MACLCALPGLHKAYTCAALVANDTLRLRRTDWCDCRCHLEPLPELLLGPQFDDEQDAWFAVEIDNHCGDAS